MVPRKAYVLGYAPICRRFGHSWGECPKPRVLGGSGPKMASVKRKAPAFSGARRIRTADLLGAIHGDDLSAFRWKWRICSDFKSATWRGILAVYALICADMLAIRASGNRSA